MGVHPLLNSSQSLAANDTSATETSTGLSYPVVLSPEESASSLNNTVFSPTTDQLSPSVSENELVPGFSHSSPFNNSNGPGYYYNGSANVAASLDHDTSNHTTSIVMPSRPTADNIVADNRTSLPLEPKTPAEYALNILFRQFAKVAEKKLYIIMNHSVV
jgi:hypothetical protein